MIAINRTVRSVIPATHIQKTGASVPPYVFILKAFATQTKAVRNASATRPHINISLISACLIRHLCTDVDTA